MKKILILMSMIMLISYSSEGIVGALESVSETIASAISSTLPEEIETTLFSEDITFTCEYINNDEMMPYALYTPSSATENDSIPLIIWLHGTGEIGMKKDNFLNRGLPKILNEWKLEGFNAYVLCPQLAGKWKSSSWHNDYSRENFQTLIDWFIDEYNVDVDNIIIVGHSSGGQGAMYMAHQLPEYFRKLVVLSGNHPKINIAEIKIPALGYVGSYGEHSSNIRYMLGKFANVFGKENSFSKNASHGGLPNVVFNEDKDENNRSDIIEWMFDDYQYTPSS